jgi:hypothetical protein
MEIVYVLIAVVAIVGVYFLFLRKGQTPTVEARPEQQKLERPRTESKPKPATAAPTTAPTPVAQGRDT